jgi:lipopolysaccharide export LptBFGC system permease protein LptF
LKERRDLPLVENLVIWDKRHRTVTLREYLVRPDPFASEAIGLSERHREDARLVSIDAARARPLSGGRWALENGVRIVDDGSTREREARPIAILDDPRFTPAEVELAWKAREHTMDLSYTELRDLLAREPTNLQYQSLLQYNLTFPLAGIVLLLVGLPFVVGNERGKAGERVARGFLLCVAYFGVDFVARTLGLQGAVGPLVSGWFPLVLFGSLGAVLTASIRS